MSEDNAGIEFEGGFFEEAGVNLNEIPDDAFGFGNDYWAIYLVECGEPKVTKNADKVGMMVKWAVDHPAYSNNKPTQEMRQWIQLPVPTALQGQIPWDPRTNPEDKKVLVDLRDLYLALGFKNDEMGKVNGAKMLTRRAMAKIKPRRNADGFWEFGLFQLKAVPAGEATNGSISQGQSNGGGTISAEEALKRAMAGEGSSDDES